MQYVEISVTVVVYLLFVSIGPYWASLTLSVESIHRVSPQLTEIALSSTGDRAKGSRGTWTACLIARSLTLVRTLGTRCTKLGS